MDMQTEAARLEAQRIIEDMRIRGETEREMIRQQAETERALARAQIEGAVKKDVAVVEAMMTQEPDGDEDEGDEYGAGE
jgi:F0F1-type ATP synthase membrane subunit b/b'